MASTKLFLTLYAPMAENIIISVHLHNNAIQRLSLLTRREKFFMHSCHNYDYIMYLLHFLYRYQMDYSKALKTTPSQTPF